MADYTYIDRWDSDGVTVVDVANPRLLDRLFINELGDELIAFVESERPAKLLISFGRVTYCSSEVIGSLIRARARVTSEGGKMKLCLMNDQVRELFRITNLDGTIFEIFDSDDEALASF